MIITHHTPNAMRVDMILNPFQFGHLLNSFQINIQTHIVSLISCTTEAKK